MDPVCKVSRRRRYDRSGGRRERGMVAWRRYLTFVRRCASATWRAVATTNFGAAARKRHPPALQRYLDVDTRDDRRRRVRTSSHAGDLCLPRNRVGGWRICAARWRRRAIGGGLWTV